MTGRGGLVAAVLLLALSTAFAALNGRNYVALDLGVLRLSRVPVSVVVFAALLAGMAVMLFAGLRSDLRVREILRKNLEQEGRREQEWRDRNQQELFGSDEDADA